MLPECFPKSCYCKQFVRCSSKVRLVSSCSLKHRSYLHTATLWEANDVWMSFTHMESARFSWNNSLRRPASTWTSQVMWKFEALLDPSVRSHLPMD